MNSEEILKVLMDCELIITGRLVDASNATLFGNLANTEELKVIYKPVAGERPLWDFPVGTLAEREYAAYLFSEEFGFNLVPTTVLRDGPYGYGMVQQWIENAQPSNLIEIAQGNDVQLRRMFLFDVLINNGDRKFGHILLAEAGKILGCDHGVSFHVVDKLRTVLWQFAGLLLTENELSLLDNIANSDLSFLSNYLTETEISALLERTRRLINQENFPQPADDRPSIPWPPV